MGTRGFVGFVIDGIEKIDYVHNDAYPSGAGADFLEWLSSIEDITAATEQARALRVIDGETPPTAGDIEHLAPWTNLNVGARSTSDWYCLLRETQGEPEQILKAGVLVDAGAFPADSLFCEWGYLVDFDAGQFEAYQGFQTEPHDKGRFASRTQLRDTSATGSSYRPVALVASWPLDKLPTTEEFVAALEEGED